jgi:hypothetical protein
MELQYGNSDDVQMKIEKFGGGGDVKRKSAECESSALAQNSFASLSSLGTFLYGTT